MKHTGSKRCQIQHLIISDFFQFACIRHLSRISSINTIHICIDLTCICMKGCCQCNGCRIGTASSKRGIIIVFVDSLKTCNNYDFTVFQFSADTLCINSFQTCISVYTCRMHRYLKCIQRYRRYSKLVKSHCHQ